MAQREYAIDYTETVIPENQPVNVPGLELELDRPEFRKPTFTENLKFNYHQTKKRTWKNLSWIILAAAIILFTISAASVFSAPITLAIIGGELLVFSIVIAVARNW